LRAFQVRVEKADLAKGGRRLNVLTEPGQRQGEPKRR
jgi:hypothetical protein